MKQTPATDIFNQTIFDLLPSDLHKVLEVGTGSGALACAYKEINKSVEYVGVEIDDAYKELSLRYCDRIYLENFESPSTDLVNEINDADVLIFSDVLEHMYDPWKVIEFLYANVKLGSRVIASIPNIQHWSIQARLLNGEFEYTETGLLDRTHIRFFTRKTMIQLFENNGFVINSITPRIFDFPNQNIYLEWIKNNANSLGLETDSSVNDAAAFQFVVDAVRPN
jgi:ubiquinone/menaquinone biosynthesis C-methylase UbiE